MSVESDWPGDALLIDTGDDEDRKIDATYIPRSGGVAQEKVIDVAVRENLRYCQRLRRKPRNPLRKNFLPSRKTEGDFLCQEQNKYYYIVT